MTCSPARISANKANARKSCGPTTPEGKERSRANALKHGLTGAGIVLPDEDAAEVALRFAELQADLRPSNGLARFLVHRTAMLSVRLERCERQESAAISVRMRHAPDAFDEDRMAEAQRLLSGIGDEPATAARRLAAMPEGIDLMVRSWEALRSVLQDPSGPAWDDDHSRLACHLMGRRPEDVPRSRVGALAGALRGDPSGPIPGEPGGRDRAVAQLIAIVDGEVDRLETARSEIDRARIDRDRAEAPTRAIFDPSKEATLARRYEAAAERGFYRALRELGEVEAASVGSGDFEAAGAVGALGSFFPVAPPIEEPPARPVGSARVEPPAESPTAIPTATPRPGPARPASEGWSSVPFSIGKGVGSGGRGAAPDPARLITTMAR